MAEAIDQGGAAHDRTDLSNVQRAFVNAAWAAGAPLLFELRLWASVWSSAIGLTAAGEHFVYRRRTNGQVAHRAVTLGTSSQPRNPEKDFLPTPGDGVLPILRGDCPGSDELPEFFCWAWKKIAALACVASFRGAGNRPARHGVAVRTAFGHSSLQ